MTTETTAFMIGYGFFLLITALLVFAWRREQMRNKELFKEKGDLIDENLKSLDIVKESLERVKELAFERIDLRKQFIEQSELATSWRQKHDRLERLNSDIERINTNLTDANNQMSYELDRGNEMITWMKADLEKARTLLFANENSIMKLLAEGKFPDEKGVYRKNYLSKKGENFPLGKYINSLYQSKVAKDILNVKDETFCLLRNNEKINNARLSNPLHDFEKIADQSTQPLADAIDWNVPQAFPIGYEVPLGIRVMALEDRPTGIRAGWKGITVNGLLTTPSIYPFVKWDIEDFNNGHACALQSCHLAPINPTDHPLHPEFKLNA
jgi:hypothetical protein